MPGAHHQDGMAAVRKANVASVIAALHSQASLTMADLASATGLSRPTLGAIIAELHKDSWVAEVDAPREQRNGRPARRFRLALEHSLVAGVDIGLHKILVEIADLSGDVRSTSRIAVSPNIDGVSRLTVCRDAVSEALARIGEDETALRSIAVGIPGVVDRTGRITASSVIPEWSNLDLRVWIRQWTDCPVTVWNDANLALAAEQWRGKAALIDDAVYLHVGRRIKAALLIAGRVHTGRTGAAGEIGASPEMSTTADPELLGSVDETLHIADTFAAARDGDLSAEEKIDQISEQVAKAVSVLSRVIDPDLVIIGGGVSSAGEVFTANVKARVQPGPTGESPIVASTLGDNSVALGGVSVALALAAEHDFRLVGLFRDQSRIGARLHGNAPSHPPTIGTA